MSIATPTLKESLKRMYRAGRVTDETLVKMMNATPPKLDQEDYDYITAPMTAAEKQAEAEALAAIAAVAEAQTT